MTRQLDRTATSTLLRLRFSNQVFDCGAGYCNSLYVGIDQSSRRRLQLVQNAAARLLAGKRKRGHITPVLASLHWLHAASGLISYLESYYTLVVAATSWRLCRTQSAFLPVDLNPCPQEVQPWCEALLSTSACSKVNCILTGKSQLTEQSDN